MNASYIQDIAKESWSGFVLFIIGYFASTFNTLSSDNRENDPTLAIVFMAVFSILAIIGILLSARLNVVTNKKVKELETKVSEMEKMLFEIKEKMNERND